MNFLLVERPFEPHVDIFEESSVGDADYACKPAREERFLPAKLEPPPQPDEPELAVFNLAQKPR